MNFKDPLTKQNLQVKKKPMIDKKNYIRYLRYIFLNIFMKS